MTEKTEIRTIGDIVNHAFAKQVVSNAKEVRQLKTSLAELNMELGVLQQRLEQHLSESRLAEDERIYFSEPEESTEEK